MAGFWAVIGLSLAVAGCGNQPPSTYVRVTTHLMHGDEPVTMDWVVECRYFKRGGFGTDTTAYTHTTIVPYVYGVTTRDGGMIIAVAPGYCASGIDPPPKDYLPVFLWGDKAGEFGFLTAYVTEAAFTNPASKLKVLDVTLARSTQEEHDAWKKTGVKNVVPAHNNPFLRNAGQTTADLRVGCGGFERIPVAPSMKGLVDAAWPAGHPRYWPVTPPIYTGVSHAFHLAANATYISNEAEYLSGGSGAFRPKMVEVWNDEHGTPQSFPLYDVVPVDFNFFHEPPAKATFTNGMWQTPRPVLANGEVKEKEIGMMYCGFFPRLFNAIDTKYNIKFADGNVIGVNYWAGFVKEDKIYFHDVGFGLNIERGDDGDE